MDDHFAKWSPELETGIIWQDLQHKELVEAVKTLYTAISKKKPEEEVQKIVAFLYDYTVHHFSMEEKHMEEYGYPDMLQHVDQHQRFIRMLEDFEKERKNSKVLANLSLCNDLQNGQLPTSKWMITKWPTS
ncbi:hemerythrin-like metal-binding protein [Chloroherpeton thalassium ATCC 35110]|uniref:Hemerythrin-like metal-binding protein n=1 Tax=Chloroherpeton thalassium (strain ATCC 35110 / GB-78) TaxID=517418 RepID=B3QY03_CHLT3|nr:bacteriohemerythrin [Chloroherpeton thalassium]ACF13531.1 hemerythrin-like metal-binding protein [Chloroherpeton thalassium ATCC 35110]